MKNILNDFFEFSCNFVKIGSHDTLKNYRIPHCSIDFSTLNKFYQKLREGIKKRQMFKSQVSQLDIFNNFVEIAENIVKVKPKIEPER